MGIHLSLYQKALDALEEWKEAERYATNTAYKHDAGKLADLARNRMELAIKEAKEYGG
jgi:hypothetical protein